MIAFTEIDQTLKSLGKNRAWLAEASGRKVDSIRVALAPNAHPSKQSRHLLTALNTALQREILAQSLPEETAAPPPPPPPPDRLTILAPPESIIRYNNAARDANQATHDWIISQLNAAADQWAQSKQLSIVAPIDPVPEKQAQPG